MGVQAWRLTNQAAYLTGVVLIPQRWKPSDPRSEHDHCKFCWEKFADYDGCYTRVGVQKIGIIGSATPAMQISRRAFNGGGAMNEYRVTKYDPKYRMDGAYAGAEWTCAADVGVSVLARKHGLLCEAFRSPHHEEDDDA